MKRPSKQTSRTLDFVASYDEQQLMNHSVIAYANLWYRVDKEFVDSIKKAKRAADLVEILKKISGQYKVSRTLYKKESAQWGKLSTQIFETLNVDESSVVDVVNKLVEDNKPKKRRPVSAISKLLWFRCQSPVKIFDSRAVNALKALGSDLGKSGDYLKYCAAWRAQYERHTPSLIKAVAEVQERLEFTLIPKSEHPEFGSLANTEKFLERAFDQYLWLIGDPKDLAHGRAVED